MTVVLWVCAFIFPNALSTLIFSFLHGSAQSIVVASEAPASVPQVCWGVFTCFIVLLWWQFLLQRPTGYWCPLNKVVWCLLWTLHTHPGVQELGEQLVNDFVTRRTKFSYNCKAYLLQLLFSLLLSFVVPADTRTSHSLLESGRFELNWSLALRRFLVSSPFEVLLHLDWLGFSGHSGWILSACEQRVR